MKKIIPILLTLILAISCDNSPKFHIEGNVEGATDSMLYLEAQTLEGIQALDSVKLKASGEFAFAQQKKVENPEFYALRIGNRRINFSVDSIETISFSIKNTPNALTYDVQGSYNSQKIKEICEQQARLQQQIIAIEKNESLLPGDVVDSINGLVDAYKEKMKNEYIFKEPLLAYSYYAVCQSITDLAGTYQLFNPLTDRADVKCYATIATAWDGQWHDAERTIQICNTAIRGMGNTAAPKQKQIQVDESKIVETSIIDIELPDIKSKFHKLTETSRSMVRRNPHSVHVSCVSSTTSSKHKVSKSIRFPSTTTFISGRNLLKVSHGFVFTRQTEQQPKHTRLTRSQLSSSSTATTKSLSATMLSRTSNPKSKHCFDENEERKMKNEE